MQNEGMALKKKPKFLCLHGFRTSGEIFRKQLEKWPESILQKFHLVFADAPFLAAAESDVEEIFDPPYYEWFQFNKEFTEYTNFEECLAYIEECMIKHGPFDGLLGFSQGAILAAALPGLQEKGIALTKVPKIKFLVIIGGATLKEPSLAEKAYSHPIRCHSIHFIGEMDYFLRDYGLKLVEFFEDPFIIHHPMGHIIPRIDEKSLPIIQSFIEKIEEVLNVADQEICSNESPSR